MNEENKSHDPCSLNLENDKGETNLCCCYTLDSEGNYDTPCYTPPEACC